MARHAWLKFLTALTVLFCAYQSHAHPLIISIDSSNRLRSDPVASMAIDDVAGLLRSAFSGAQVVHNARACQVRIVLPDVVATRDHCIPVPSGRHYFCTAVPDASYRWQSGRRMGTIVIKLESATPDGVAAGLYGLLQEKLERSLLLLTTFEIKNGCRAHRFNGFTKRLVSSLSESVINRLSNKYNLQPYGATPWVKGIVGGSDDHSGLFIARAQQPSTRLLPLRSSSIPSGTATAGQMAMMADR